MLKPWLILGAAALVSLAAAQGADKALLLKPDDPEMSRRAPDTSRLLLDTSRGRIVLDMTRAWSPHGVDCFYNLVRHGYYDEALRVRDPREDVGPVRRGRPIRRLDDRSHARTIPA